jgi:hypothetical protein
MVANTNDGSNRAPYLRCDITGGNIFSLPPESSGPHGDERTVLQMVKNAGFHGVQGADRKLCAELGLGCTAGGRVDRPEQADPFAAQVLDGGYECATLHVGWGLEDDDLMFALVDAIISASIKRNIPLYIETHRATITQDIWRTVQIAKKFPEVRFNGDFSHWYTGLEMVYGGFENKIDFAAPVFERVRFIHGRIGNPGSMQVDIGDGTGRTYVDHFKEMWIRSFAGFLRSAKPGDFFCFAPELLYSENFYARLIRDASGKYVEEVDRWQQAIVYMQIAKQCFDEARKRVGATATA